MRSNSSNAKDTGLCSRRTRLLLILGAAILHISVTTTVFMLARTGVLSGQFDQKGLGNFASDGFMYETEVLELCGVLKNQGVVAWAGWPTQLHVRLYSLPVAAINGGRYFNILTIEPLNLIYFLAILMLAYKIGEAVFTQRTGLLAAAIVAVWPSFLLHSTQLLRDPLLIVAFLLFILSIIFCLKRNYDLGMGTLAGFSAATGILLVRIVRLPMWSLMWVTALVAIAFLIAGAVRRRRLSSGQIAFSIIVLTAMLVIPRFQTEFRNQQMVKRPGIIAPEEVQKLPVDDQIVARRRGFELALDPSGKVVPSQAGSDIDREIRFNGLVDIVRHLPRAVVVGFLAPFPNMWLVSGKQVGGGGRLLSGFEMLISYMIECLALVGLWQKRKDFSAWFLFLVMALGAIALGLVVANIGALFRLRYPFWILLIACGAGGADYLNRRRAAAVGRRPALSFEKPAGTIHS